MDSVHIAAEHYRYWRSEGLSLRQMEQAINHPSFLGSLPNGHSQPDAMTGDGMVYWLSMIWDGL